MNERQQERMSMPNPSIFQANYTNSHNSNNKKPQNSYKVVLTTPHQFGNTNSYFAQHLGKDRNKDFKFNNVQCQICKKMGHTVARCYFRYS